MRKWWITVGVGFLLSASTKILADSFLRAPVPIVGSWFGLDYALNPGIAFGVVLPFPLQSILIGAAFATMLWFSPQWLPYPLCRVGIGLILGGAAANITDRLRDGVVTDFIVLWPFPLFNVADLLITLGALCLILGECGPKVSRKALAEFWRKW